MLKFKHLIFILMCWALVHCAAPAAINCPGGTKLLGELPPDGYEQWCARKSDGQSVRHGGWIAWHTKTRKKALGQYDEGIESGHWQGWHENGAKEWEGDYKNGERHGAWTLWH